MGLGAGQLEELVDPSDTGIWSTLVDVVEYARLAVSNELDLRNAIAAIALLHVADHFVPGRPGRNRYPKLHDIGPSAFRKTLKT